MRVCVVGAGAAGLCAARHLLAEPCVSDVDILEQSSQLGGTWVYTENVGYDDFGLPIHTSMYKSLRTNLPKEIMGFPDFPIPESEKSYIPAKDMLSFLQLYSDKHGITEHIKFKHHVQLIIPKQGGTRELWDVTWKDLESGVSTTKEYDYVFVCNGHYNTPFIPNIPGLKEFKGDVMHSHDYRVPSIFTNKRVLVVGAGPSGMDIALEITGVTKSVILSHHLKEQIKSVFPDNLIEKPDVIKLDGHTAFFKDGSQEDVDVVFLCTGYLYNFPFLHESCDIVVEDNCVEPLYKHLVNIKHPSMCFIGVPYYVCAFSMFDLQVRFYVRSMNGTFKLPSSEEMIEHWEEEKRDRAARGYTKRQAHMMGPDQAGYYLSLAVESGEESLPEVLISIYKVSAKKFYDDIASVRSDVYTLIDDKTFVLSRVDSAGYYISLAIESGAEPLPDVFTTVHNHSSQKFLDDIAGFRSDVYTLIDDKNFEKYYASLAVEANTKNLPSVITKIREESSIRFLHNLQNYRQDVYKIIDDDTYEIISNGKREILC